MDGIKITQLSKADNETKDIPTILVTAHAMQGDKDNFLTESGANGYISKPVVDHQNFVDTVKAMIND